MKKSQWLRIMLTIMVCIAGVTADKTHASAASDTMKIVSIDLGQENTGEATMISDGSGRSLLVDSGDNHNDSIFRWLDKNGYKKKKFDTLVTHWHDDHAGNTAKIIRQYNIGTVYLPSPSYTYTEDSDYYRYERGYATRVLAAAKDRGTRVVYLKKGMTIKVGTVRGKVLYVNGSPKDESWYDVQYYNNQSAVIMFTGGGSKFLAAGDSQEQAENRLLKSGVSLKADIYKLSHHGYDRSNTQKLLDAVKPVYTYFSNYKSTPSKYLHNEIKDSVTRSGGSSNVMGTRYNGTITYTCKGGDIRVNAGRNVRRMYQRLIDKKTNTGRNVTFEFNNACDVHKIKNVLNSDKYYNRQLNANGSLFSGKWVKVGNKYRLRSNGIYAYNTFAKANNRVYWFNMGGYRSDKGFINAYGRRYYMLPRRAIGFRTINNKRYYFMGKKYSNYKEYLEGMMMTGFKVISGKLYYFQDPKCKEYKKADLGKNMIGFFTVSGKTYYSAEKNMKGYTPSMYGVIQKGWRTIRGNRYYLGKNGVVRKGWQTIDGVRYHFDENGILIGKE